MPDLLTDNIYTIAGAAIATIGIARFYYGPRFREIPWQPLRRVFIPIAHKLAQRSVGEEFYAKNEAKPKEHVATLKAKPEAVIEDLGAADYVVEPLAGLKTNWNGDTEVASYARHRGSRPFPGAPEWLRRRQVHVTLFPTAPAPDGSVGTIVTAHEELNSWRPDLAERHYRGETMDVQKGRELAAADLGIDLEDDDANDGS
ncbi:hypothetical protein [Natrinema thermotolerans]|uniref:hypothetical protein n=1 Tax=Natrinema thermotolerans TaxID=121872 RepID=UPI000678A666|nr:hypothetical protein [Natrinema thermotolerans]QCC57349.1 hypothetical protein DVR14_01320 [Natrinema thermotolerans]